MTFEKSCGAVIFKYDGELEYLIILNKKGDATGHWGFPKGHVENGETEFQTAKREIFEETGLSPELIKGFRAVSKYTPKPDVSKDSVYFLAEYKDGEIILQKSELADYKWCKFQDALDTLTFDVDILKSADKFLKENIIR